jgi:DNA-binding XRE family transcriptional regulator
MEDMGMTAKASTKGVSLDDMIARMPVEDQREVEQHAATLIAQHHALRDVRKAMGKTQAAIAKQLGIKQENVARIEQRGDMLLSTLRSYVRALGGDVRLVVEVKGHAPVELDGLGELAPAARGKRGVARPTRGRRAEA